MKFEKNILMTGAAGFIGSHAARLMVNQYPNYRIVVLDKLTYAGDLNNIADLNGKSNFVFVKGDITDAGLINQLFVDPELCLSAQRVMHPRKHDEQPIARVGRFRDGGREVGRLARLDES